MSAMSGIGTLNFSSDLETSRPLPNNPTAAPGPAAAQRMAMRRMEASPNFHTPTFGVLPRSSVARSDLGAVAIRIDFSSPSLSVLTPAGLTPPPAPNLGGGGQGGGGAIRQKRNIMASKENPLKPNVFGQSANNSGNQNITPSGNTHVRRSSRLGLSQSVKENSSKAPTKKARAPKSPKTRGRQALSSTQSDLAEKNEKNKAEREKSEKDSDDMIKQQSQVQQPCVNLSTQALVIQKQSLDGLMQLLRQMGVAYLELSKYNCRKAITLLEGISEKHRKTGWILGLMGKAHFELAEYKEAKT